MPALPRRLAHRIAAEDASRPLWRHPITIAAAALALTAPRSQRAPHPPAATTSPRTRPSKT